MAGIDNTTIFSSGERLTPSSSGDIIRMQQVGTDVARINGAGSPEGVVSANPSSLFHDTTNGNVYIKHSGTGNTGWVIIDTLSPNNIGVISIGTTQIDYKSTGATKLLTTEAKTFIILFVTSLGINVTGPLSGVLANIGWTGPNYDDWSNGLSLSVGATGEVTAQVAVISPLKAIPPSTDVYINIVAASTYTTDTEKVSLVGFYI